MKLSPEEIEQVQVFDFIRSNPSISEISMHIANERKCSLMRGRLLKRMGVLPGVSDIFIPKSANGFDGLWVELKAGSNKTTPLQDKFIENMIREGYQAVTVNGAKDTINLITEFYSL